jgi:methyl-accepting chemotaxis protein
MGSSIKEIASNAADAAKIATQAVEVAAGARSTVGKLGASSVAIGKFVKVIRAIADQTNLLALNATIEAARAGDAGRGFAVVAKEVKELAKETARANEEIAQRINEIQADTSATTKAIEEIGEIIGSVNAISATIASSVEEQTSTTNEMGRHVTAAAHASAEIVSHVDEVGLCAQRSATGAQRLGDASIELVKIAEGLQKISAR